jgi:Spy/CpxP family protein refolding chaperone
MRLPISLIAGLGFLSLIGCESNPAPFEVGPEESADFALVAFGEAGAALEGSMGPQGPRPFDGASLGLERLPPHLALNPDQRRSIGQLRSDFHATYAEPLEALGEIFRRAWAAREAGADRKAVRAILQEGRPLVQQLREPVRALHAATVALLTVEQRAWLEANRPRRRPRGAGGGMGV